MPIKTGSGARKFAASNTSSAFRPIQILRRGEYLRVREYLQAGRVPPKADDTSLRVSELADEFLNAKRVLKESGELSPRSFRDYHAGCAQIVEHFGKERLVSDCRPEDFTAYRQKISKTRGLHSIGWAVTLTRILFGFAYDSELIEKPIRFGQQFNKPTKKSMRLDRAKKQEKHGLKMFHAEEIRQLADGASVQVKAMILLAVNGGLGNSDLENLPQSAIHGSWLVFPRVKTGVERRIPLWPELPLIKRTETKAELKSLCFSLARGTPFGSTHW